MRSVGRGVVASFRDMSKDVIPVNPITLTCPRCKAKRGQDCETTSEGYSVIHVARIKAAASLDIVKRRNRAAARKASRARAARAKH